MLSASHENLKQQRHFESHDRAHQGAHQGALQRGQITVKDINGAPLNVSYLATNLLEHLTESTPYERILLVCLHQSPSSAESFQALSSALSRRLNGLSPELFVLAIDSPGFGESDSLAVQSPDLEGLAAPLLALILQFSEALSFPQLHLCGHHTGASLALALGVQLRAQVSSLILLGLPALPAIKQIEYQRYTDCLRAQVQAEQAAFDEPNGEQSPLIEALKAELLAKDLEASPEVIDRELTARLKAGARLPDAYEAVFSFDHAEALSRLQTRVLLIAPRADRLSAFTSYQQKLLNAIGLEHCVIEVTGGGYVLDTAPEPLSGTLIEWLLPTTLAPSTLNIVREAEHER